MSGGFISEGISAVFQSRIHISSFWPRSWLCKYDFCGLLLK